MERLKVYLSSPYTVGNAGTNVKKHLDCTHLLIDCGFIPFAPLLTHFLHMNRPRHYEEWMQYDLEWVKACDALLRMPGESNGADRETFLARDIGLHTFSDLGHLINWVKSNSEYYYINPDISVENILEKYSQILFLDV
jgi:hypothetical protein